MTWRSHTGAFKWLKNTHSGRTLHPSFQDTALSLSASGRNGEILVVLTGSSSIVIPKHSIPAKPQVSKPAIITMF